LFFTGLRTIIRITTIINTFNITIGSALTQPFFRFVVNWDYVPVSATRTFHAAIITQNRPLKQRAVSFMQE